MSEAHGAEKIWLHWIDAQYALADLRYEASLVNPSYPNPTLKAVKAPSRGWTEANVKKRATLLGRNWARF